MLRFLLTMPFVALTIFAQCPVEVVKVNPSETQSWDRSLRSGADPKKLAAMPPDFVVKLKNISGKGIRGLVILAASYDATEDLHIIPALWDAPSAIKIGEEKTLKWDNFVYSHTAATGWVVIPTKILFEDGTKWRYSLESKGCYGEYWRNQKHPRITGLPDELLKKALEGDSQ